MFTGLCASCVHHRWIISGRGSRFLFCEYSKHDPAFPKYPPLPVFDCSACTPPGNDAGGLGQTGRSLGGDVDEEKP